MPDFESMPVGTAQRLERLEQAVKPFADYADQRRVMPPSFEITRGSMMAKRQLTMGDCYRALDAMKDEHDGR